jgi:single-stranded-DNA-specific exonuclease
MIEPGARSSLAAPRRWVLRADDAGREAAAAIASTLNLPLAMARLLQQRGHADADAARRFLKPRLDALHDPMLLTDVAVAVERIARAIRNGEHIMVHGDYDVDGMCAAALYTRVLRSLGARVDAFVPHRMTDGYDLGYAGVRRAVELGSAIILTGDCGMVAHDAIREATAAGIDVIVSDHHTPGAHLPDARAVLNPNRADCHYPEKGLAGAGVAYKLCEALVGALNGDHDALRWHLDLVALATIADLAPLRGENRVLAHYGLRVLRETKSPGLRALMQCAGVSAEHALTAGQISHVLAPRLNAVGRMGAASRGVDLLLADDEATAQRLAQEMEEENRTRQNVDRRILQEALTMLESSYDAERDYTIVLSSPEWHAGVIGIVASRVVECVHRPVVLFTEDTENGRARGSARSIPRFHLFNAVHACGSLLERYGGHRQAAGMEIRLDKLDAFRTALNEHAHAVLQPDDLVAEIRVDLDIELGEANSELHRLLRHCGPFGLGNPQPVFMVRGVGVSGYPREVGDGQHLKMMLAQGDARLPAIGFHMAERLRSMDILNAPFDVLFQLSEDSFNGRSQLQARLLDLRPTA